MSKASLKVLFILLLSSSALISCGKKVEDVSSGKVQHSREVDSNQFSINYQHSAFAATQTVIPRNANFKIPDTFNFSSEVDLNQPLQVFYNFTPQPYHFEFKCVYLPDNDAQKFILSQCFNFAGSNLGAVLGIDFMLDEGKSVLVQSSETHIFEAFIHHQVEWK